MFCLADLSNVNNTQDPQISSLCNMHFTCSQSSVVTFLLSSKTRNNIHCSNTILNDSSCFDSFFRVSYYKSALSNRMGHMRTMISIGCMLGGIIKYILNCPTVHCAAKLARFIFASEKGTLFS